MLEILLQYCYNPARLTKLDLKQVEINELLRLSEYYAIYDLSEYISHSINGGSSKSPKCSNAQEMKQLIDYKHLSDITFSVNDRDFHLHKVILGSRSIWFENLCVNGKFKESSQSVIKLETISKEIFEIVVEYIYTGYANVGALAVQILLAADELDLKGLLKICESEILHHLTIENIISTAQFAERYNASTLLEECIKIILDNEKTLQSTTEFTELSSNIKLKLKELRIKKDVIIKLYPDE